MSARVASRHGGLPVKTQSAARVAGDVKIQASPVQKRLRLWVPFLLILCWAAVSVWLLQGGIKHPELDTYLPYHLSKGSLFQKIFDSNTLDGNTFQARELSYLFDHYDIRVIAWSAQAGIPHFISASNLLFIFLLTLWVWRFCRRDLCLNTFQTVALTILFLSSPCVVLSNSAFRSSKVGAALLTVVFAIALIRFTKNRGRSGWHIFSTCGGLFVLGFLALRFDRQAVFLLGMALFSVLVWAAASWNWRALFPGLSIMAALAADVLYNYIVAPQLTMAANGYWPNFDYQSIPLGDFFGNIGHYLAAGLGLAVDTLRFFAGNVPRALALTLLAGICWIHWFDSRHPSGQKSRGFFAEILPFAPVLIIAGLFALVVLLNALMVCRHSALVWEDVRRIYYWLPVTALWFVGAAVTTQLVQKRSQLSQRLLTVGLFALVIGNLVAIPKHVAVLRHGHLGGDCSSQILHALRCSSSNNTVSPAIANHRVYRVLKDGANPFNEPAYPRLVIENERWRAEIQSLESNRSVYAYVVQDQTASEARGSIIRVSPSLIERSGLFGAMSLDGTDGTPHRFLARFVHPDVGVLYKVKVRVCNKTSVSIPFRIGSLSITLAGGKPLVLFAVGLDNWLICKEAEADRAGAVARTVAIDGGQSQQFVYAFAGEDLASSFMMKLDE